MDLTYRLIEVTERLVERLGRGPTVVEIAFEMEVSLETVRELVRGARDPDPPESPPATGTSLAIPKEELSEALKRLTESERTVLIMRFGLEGGRRLSRDEVADELGLPRERVRQIEAKALRKLRHP